MSKPSHCQDDKPLYSYFSSQLDKDFTHEPNIYLYFILLGYDYLDNRNVVIKIKMNFKLNYLIFKY